MNEPTTEFDYRNGWNTLRVINLNARAAVRDMRADNEFNPELLLRILAGAPYPGDDPVARPEIPGLPVIDGLVYPEMHDLTVVSALCFYEEDHGACTERECDCKCHPWNHDGCCGFPKLERPSA